MGSTIFNVGTFFAPELKVGNAAKAGKFGRAAEVVAKATDPLVLLQRTAEAMKSLKGVTVEGLSRLTRTADHLGDVVRFDSKVDIDLPLVKREDTGTDHTNLGDRNHADTLAVVGTRRRVVLRAGVLRAPVVTGLIMRRTVPMRR